jgi:hypothetical protein
MSASVVRDGGGGRLSGFLRRVTAPACALLALVLVAVPAVSAPSRDSGGVVQRVRIGPAGIRVQRAGGADSAVVEVRQGGRRIARIDVSTDDAEEEGGGVTVRSGDERHSGAIVVEAGQDALVRLFADASVPAGQTFPGDVVAVFGSADVAGTVEGDVVAVLGSVRLHPGARVEGDAVAIGGGLDQPAGAEVDGQSIAIGDLVPRWHMPTAGILLVFALAGWVATLLLTWLLSLLVPRPMLRVGGAASRHTAGSFLLGLLSSPFLLLVIGLVVLAAVAGGLTLAVPAFLLGLLLPAVGQVAGTYVLGCKLMRRRPGESGLMAPVFVGSLLVALLFLASVALSVPTGVARSLSLFFATLGMLLVTLLTTIGVGAMLIALMSARPAPPAATAPAPPPRS